MIDCLWKDFCTTLRFEDVSVDNFHIFDDRICQSFIFFLLWSYHVTLIIVSFCTLTASLHYVVKYKFSKIAPTDLSTEQQPTKRVWTKENVIMLDELVLSQ